MVGLTHEQISLVDITRREVDLYAGNTQGAAQYSVADNDQQLYLVVTVPENPAERPAWVGVMARVVGDYVVIDEDTSVDKPLYEALMANGGVPREKIILAYRGETLPESPA
jgi:hypothetical protein